MRHEGLGVTGGPILVVTDQGWSGPWLVKIHPKNIRSDPWLKKAGAAVAYPK